jgi:hypothetical protein
VKIPDLVDPLLNTSYTEMARHYGTTLVPARPRKPKDKAADENMVGNISRRIIAALRNHQFFSLFEITRLSRQNLSGLSIGRFRNSKAIGYQHLKPLISLHLNLCLLPITNMQIG